jgi:hypothetical protein
MYRFALALVLSTQAVAALAAGGSCSVAGKAYDFNGRPMRDAVLRLTDQQTGQTVFSAANTDADFVFNGLNPDSSGRYRIDVLSPPTVVTGTMIPTRSILGMTRDFACAAGQSAHQDVRAQVY